MEQLLQHCFIDSEEGTCIEYCKYSSMGAPRVADASCQCIRAAKTRCRALEHFGGLMHALVLSLSSGWRSLTVQAKPAAHPPAEARQCIYSKLNIQPLQWFTGHWPFTDDSLSLHFIARRCKMVFIPLSVCTSLRVCCVLTFCNNKTHFVAPCALFCPVCFLFSQQLRPHYVCYLTSASNLPELSSLSPCHQLAKTRNIGHL